MIRVFAAIRGTRDRRRWNGFTLVELLVVIAIIGVLVALLLPAVQAAREAARRTQCKNNLRQLGLALHNHHDSKGAFPPGIVMTGPCCDTITLSGWSIEILPYMEDATLRSLYNPQLSNGDIFNQSVRETYVPVHHCPSDFPPELLLPDSGPEGAWMAGNPRRWMTGSYRGMSGRSDGLATWDLAEDLHRVPYEWRGPLHATGREADGLSIDLDAEKFSNITDGTSKTLLAGEHTNIFHPRRTFWAYTFGDYILSEAVEERRIFEPNYEVCLTIPGDARPCMRTWYSFHPGGANFIRCDGSGTWINFDIDLQVFGGMGSVAGEETLAEGAP